MLSIDVLELVEAPGLFADLPSVDEYCHKNVIVPRIRKPKNGGRRLIKQALLAGNEHYRPRSSRPISRSDRQPLLLIQEFAMDRTTAQ